MSAPKKQILVVYITTLLTIIDVAYIHIETSTFNALYLGSILILSGIGLNALKRLKNEAKISIN